MAVSDLKTAMCLQKKANHIKYSQYIYIIFSLKFVIKLSCIFSIYDIIYEIKHHSNKKLYDSTDLYHIIVFLPNKC